MSVFTTFRRWLRPQHARVNLHPEPLHRRPTPEKPVAIDLHAEDDVDLELEGFDPGNAALPEPRPARSRQELIAELQRNYQEVLGIVRKVDAHLDEQGNRSRRLTEIAERFPAAAADLAGLREGQGLASRAMEGLSVALRERDDRLSQGQQAQLERLDEISGLMAESSQAERQLIGSLLEFRDVMGSMRGATDRLADAVERIEQREAERAGDFLKALETTRSWMITLAIIGGVCAAVALTLGIASLG